MTISDFLEKLENVKENHHGKYSASCPCHDDKNRKLSITIGEKWILTHCYRGCSTEEICNILGIRVSDLAFDPPSAAGKFNKNLELAEMFVDLHRPKPQGLERAKLVQSVAARIDSPVGGDAGGGRPPARNRKA